MEPHLIGNFIRFPTAQLVWESIATTYFDGSDTSQIYELKKKIAQLTQHGGTLENYYNNLQGLWREIDFRRPNPMKCAQDIAQFNRIKQEDRVYTFLDGLDDRLDNVRADVLQLPSLPTVEQAYALVRKEDSRQSMMLGHAGMGLIARRGGGRRDEGSNRRRQAECFGEGLTGDDGLNRSGPGLRMHMGW
jgi:hypothetical protein